MENYLRILENSLNKVKKLEEELANVNKKLNKLEKKNQGIYKEYEELTKRLEVLNKYIPESESLINNAAFWGLIVIITIIISFFLFQISGLPIILPALGMIFGEAAAFIIIEKYIKRKFQKIRQANATSIEEEKNNLAELDSKHKEVDKKLRDNYSDKYRLEESIMEEEQIASEVLGYFAPLLDDLIKETELSSSEYLTEAISRISSR